MKDEAQRPLYDDGGDLSGGDPNGSMYNSGMGMEAGAKHRFKRKPERKPEHKPGAHRPRKIGKTSLGFLALIALFVAVALWVFVSDHSTLLLGNGDGDVPAGYLPASEYSLVDQSTGKPVASTRTTKYSQFTQWDDNSDGAHCSVNKKRCNHALVTSRGIRPGSSWDDFVRAYGDMTVDEIKVDANGDDDYYKSYMSDEDRLAEEDVREHRGVTVASFDRDYVKTGKVDLANNQIVVTFRAGYQSGKMLYTADEQWEGYYKSIEKRRWHIGRQSGELSGPALRYFKLEFDFSNSAQWEGAGEGDVIDISSSLYTN